MIRDFSFGILGIFAKADCGNRLHGFGASQGDFLSSLLERRPIFSRPIVEAAEYLMS